MILEIKSIHPNESDPYPDNTRVFSVAIRVSIGEKDKAGAEVFHFVAASPQGLQSEIGDKGFTLLRGYILMDEYDYKIIYRAIENLINHARSRSNWDEVISYLSQYGWYDSEDMT